MPIKILLADDHKMLREGLRALVERQDELEVVGEADSGSLALKLVRELKPDVLVMDVAMAGLNGIEATREINAQCPSTKVVALSMHIDRPYVAGMLGAGASGYVDKSSAFEDLVEAIRVVFEGGRYISANIGSVVLEDYVRQLAEPAQGRERPLTEREREVLRLVAAGKSTKEIAGQLDISTNTVDTHRRHIMEKLGLRSVAELTKYAIRKGLTSVGK